MKFETKAGQFSRGETYAQLSEKLIEVQELIHILGHDSKAQGDDNIAKMWHIIGENIKKMQALVRSLATGRIKSGVGFQ